MPKSRQGPVVTSHLFHSKDPGFNALIRGLMSLSVDTSPQLWMSGGTRRQTLVVQLSTFPQPRLSTVAGSLTSEFLQIIHRRMHRPLPLLAPGLA